MISQHVRHPSRLAAGALLTGLLAVGAACQTTADPTPEPTPAPVQAVVEQPTQEIAAVPATWTPLPAVVVVEITSAPTEPPPATATPFPTATAVPATNTPEATPTEEPTATPLPTNTAVPQAAAPAKPAAPVAAAALPSNPVLGDNLLPNPSFEEGHWNQDGVPELQLPNGWRLEFELGPTGFGNESWDNYVRPETRVLSTAFLPPEEHGLFIFDGSNTVKIFKGTGAVSTRLLTDIELQPGTYVLEGNFYSDVFESYSDKRKNAPANPSAGEAALIAGPTGTGWIGNNYLNKNKLSHTFTINTAQKVPVGISFRGRYAIANNGWFVDNLSLRRVQ